MNTSFRDRTIFLSRTKLCPCSVWRHAGFICHTFAFHVVTHDGSNLNYKTRHNPFYGLLYGFLRLPVWLCFTSCSLQETCFQILVSWTHCFTSQTDFRAEDECLCEGGGERGGQSRTSSIQLSVSEEWSVQRGSYKLQYWTRTLRLKVRTGFDSFFSVSYMFCLFLLIGSVTTLLLKCNWYINID